MSRPFDLKPLADRLLGNRKLPRDQRFTNTNVPVEGQKDELVPSALMGPVQVRAGVRRSVNA